MSISYRLDLPCDAEVQWRVVKSAAAMSIASMRVRRQDIWYPWLAPSSRVIPRSPFTVVFK